MSYVAVMEQGIEDIEDTACGFSLMSFFCCSLALNQPITITEQSQDTQKPGDLSKPRDHAHSRTGAVSGLI